MGNIPKVARSMTRPMTDHARIPDGETCRACGKPNLPLCLPSFIQKTFNTPRA